jgi:hypothetical protein
VYEADSSAPAVILCDYGHLNSTINQFSRLLRIKILKKEGYSWANSTFSFRGDKPGIKGTTFNLENGKVVASKLKSESIFMESVNDRDLHRIQIAMPNVKEGSVIDIEIFFQGLPYEWRFQDMIPVRWSELVIEPTFDIMFQKTFFGTAPLAMQTDTRWVGVDMPAFKEEPYTSSVNNHISKLEIELSEIHIQDYHRFYSSSWKAVNSFFLKYDAYGSGSGITSFLNSIANEIKQSTTNKETLLRKALEHVKKVKWNNEDYIIPSTTGIGYTYKKGLGNVADVNLILFQLLKKLDFDVSPVVLRTRSSGLLSKEVPTIDNLNYVIVKAKVDDKSYLIDATEEWLPCGLLPERCMNGEGRTVADNPEWVNLRSDKKEKEITSYTLQLDSKNLNLKGSISCKKQDYAAYFFRKDFKSFNSKNEYLDDFKKDKPGLSIMDAAIKNIDSLYLPVQNEYKVEINNHVAEIDGELYIYPLLFNQLKETPFKAEDRTYPVDFPYLVETTIVGTINLPENYTVLSVPSPVKLQLPNNTASMTYQIAFENNSLQLSYKFNINKEVFSPLGMPI